MDEIREVLGGDWRKAVLFLRGSGMTEKNIADSPNDIAKAVMIDSRMMNDPYVRSSIYQAIRHRIDEAKVGVLKVHGNYSIVCGDPYALCQSIFGIEVTGLLSAGEIYNQYWADKESEKLACFRAPMTCHNNIKIVRPARSEEVRHWFQYITTGTVFNVWDTTTAALNGCDFDGDLVMLSDNRILVEKHIETPTLMCAQRKAGKCIPTEEDFVKANIASFGNEIGQTTNWITSMFEVQSHYRPESKEYKELTYRIMCGQLYQQNSIDKAKGIVCKPMPRTWHDRHAIGKIEDEQEYEFYRSIVADKKPYFMRYIYPQLMSQYNTYIRNTDKNALRRFGMTVKEMQALPAGELSEEQLEFLRYFQLKMPVGTGDCVMNRICRAFEDEFDGFLGKPTGQPKFNYGIMRSEAEYTQGQFYRVKKAYEYYTGRLRSYSVFTNYERPDEEQIASDLMMLEESFREECDSICSNREALCNIVLDLCYTKSSTKRFAWEMCRDNMIQNLLRGSGGMITFPVKDGEGDILYCGERFKMVTMKIAEFEEADR